MSFRIIEPATPRLNRSQLAVPGIRPELFEKAAASDADVVFLDLEDAVAPDDKEKARKNVIEGLNDIDWGTKTVSVRINGLDTPYMYRDVIEVVEQAGERLDLILIPKAGNASDIYAVDVLVTQIEMARGYERGDPRAIGFEILIESAEGMININDIAAASRRNESLHFGPGDYAASIKARTTTMGAANADYGILADADEAGHRSMYPGDMWHYPLSRLVIAARANGLRPVDGPLADFSDHDGFIAAAKRSAALGCEGKWAIHPSQVPLANQVFTPAPDELDQAKRILDAMAEAEREGKGAVALDGPMIDIASIKQAQVMVRKAEMIAARGKA
ncbi:MAG: CoA ester lyase [Alphaproteobacteria bacterium]